MATYYSTQAGLYNANKQIPPNLKGNYVRNSKGVVTTSAAAASSDVLVLAGVPSNAVLTSVRVANTALGGSGAMNVGLLRQDLTAISATLFATARSTASASAADLLTGAAALIPKLEQPLWQLAGLTADPNETFWVAATISTAGSSAGTVAAEVEYTA